jgi:hypothetical protein
MNTGHMLTIKKFYRTYYTQLWDYPNEHPDEDEPVMRIGEHTSDGVFHTTVQRVIVTGKQHNNLFSALWWMVRQIHIHRRR